VLTMRVFAVEIGTVSYFLETGVTANAPDFDGALLNNPFCRLAIDRVPVDVCPRGCSPWAALAPKNPLIRATWSDMLGRLPAGN
jgi:hypothetical protein